MNMQSSAAQAGISSRENKKEFRINPASTMHAKRYSFAQQFVERQNAQVSRKKPPVSATESSRPDVNGFLKRAPSSAGTIYGWSGKNSKTPTSCTGASEQKEIEFGAFRSFPDSAEDARNRTMSLADDLSNSPFSEAADRWIEIKLLHNRESTVDCYRDYLVPLRKFFDPLGLTLRQIHIGHIEEYQRVHRKKYHPASVNHHINTLSQIMRKAGLWGAIEEHYHALPLPEQDPPKVLSEYEETRFFEFAASNKDWQLAYNVASLTNNSTASGKELRMLKLEAIHLDTDPPYFHVPKNMKTAHRQRNIPLNERGAEMMRRCMTEAAKRGSTRPEHYLFPFRVKRNLFDPTRPASESWLRYRWKLLVDAAMRTCIHCFDKQNACQCDKFRPVLPFRLKPHNMRHQCITRMIDSGTPIELVRMIAGHGVDSIATRGYIHGRMEVMARAMDAIDPGNKKPASISTSRNGKGQSA